jgi:hypothetical protein
MKHDDMPGMEVSSNAAPQGGSLKETLKSMTVCNDTFAVKKGDVFTLRADYDLAAHGL